MRRAAEGLITAILLLGAAPLAAQQAPAASTDARSGDRQSLEELRPSGPITVKADRVEWVQDNLMKYTGNVSMVSDTLTVSGASMDVKQASDGQFDAVIHGTPARLDHAAKPDASGPAAQAVHAEAQQIHYDSRTGTVDMSGGAHLKRGDDEVSGDTIGYVVPERRIRAAGGGSGQVTITFQPPPAKKDQNGDAAKKDGKP